MTLEVRVAASLPSGESGNAFPAEAEECLRTLYAGQRHPPQSDHAKIRLFRRLGYGIISSCAGDFTLLRKAHEFAYLTDLGVI